MNLVLPSDIVIKLVLAVLIGGAIGAEREYRSKSAGFRTLTLICLGSTILTIFSVIIGTPRQSRPDRLQHRHGDRLRRRRRHLQGRWFRQQGQRDYYRRDDLGNGRPGRGHRLPATCSPPSLPPFSSCWYCLFLCCWKAGSTASTRSGSIRSFVNSIAKPSIGMKSCFECHHLKFRRSGQRKSAENMITGEWVVQGSESNHRHCIHEVLRDQTVREFEF